MSAAAPVAAAAAIPPASAAVAEPAQKQPGAKTSEKEKETEKDLNKEKDKGSIHLEIKSQDGTTIMFKVKPTTVFRKIMIAYAKRFGGDINGFRFLFDGVRIRPEQTPVSLNMEDGSQIDCMLVQTGG